MMTWYRDQIHFRVTLGTKVLNSMSGQSAFFGLLLTQGNLEPHIKHLRQDLAIWQSKFKRDSDDIDVLLM